MANTSTPTPRININVSLEAGKAFLELQLALCKDVLPWNPNDSCVIEWAIAKALDPTLQQRTFKPVSRDQRGRPSSGGRPMNIAQYREYHQNKMERKVAKLEKRIARIDEMIKERDENRKARLEREKFEKQQNSLSKMSRQEFAAYWANKKGSNLPGASEVKDDSGLTEAEKIKMIERMFDE